MRRADITSTEAAALFGLSPYLTAWEAYHQKTGQLSDELEEAFRMTAGKKLEPVIAGIAAEELGVRHRALNAYARHSVVPNMGASFDYEIVAHEAGPGIMEVKNVDYLVWRDQWADDEAPPHIEIQVQHQLEVMNREWAIIALLVGGNDLKLIRRTRDREIGDLIAKKVCEFWGLVEEGKPPDPDFEKDGKAIRTLFRDASETAEPLDLRGDNLMRELCDRYQEAGEREKEAKKAKDAASAEILYRIGEAPKAFVEGFTISAKTTAECRVSYTRKAFRNLRLTAKKGKAA